MNNPTPPDTPEEVVAETQVPQAPVVAAPPPNDNRRRMRELLSIPERDRTDEQWDELIELEIQMAPGNRISGPEQGFGGSGKPMHGRPGGGAHQKKPHRPRPPQAGANAGGPSQGGGGGGGNNRRPRQNKPPQGNPSA